MAGKFDVHSSLIGRHLSERPSLPLSATAQELRLYLFRSQHQHAEHARHDKERGHVANEMTVSIGLAKDCSVIMAPCTTLDHTVNEIMLLYACGSREASSKNTPSVA